MKEMSLEDKQRIDKLALEHASHEPYGAQASESYIAGATREHERMAELLKEHKAIIRELLLLLEQGGINPELKSILEAKKANESLKGKSQ